MAELAQIRVVNPTDEEYVVYKNGEPYAVRPNSDTTYPHHLARHMAKVMSDQMITKDVFAERAKFKKTKEVFPEIREIQMTMYDNPQRRIYLYQILRDKTEVERTIKAYPQFKTDDVRQNFVGEMSEYDDWVSDFEAKNAPKEEVIEEKTSEEEKPKRGRPPKK